MNIEKFFFKKDAAPLSLKSFKMLRAGVFAALAFGFAAITLTLFDWFRGSPESYPNQRFVSIIMPLGSMLLGSSFWFLMAPQKFEQQTRRRIIGGILFLISIVLSGISLWLMISRILKL